MNGLESAVLKVEPAHMGSDSGSGSYFKSYKEHG